MKNPIRFLNEVIVTKTVSIKQLVQSIESALYSHIDGEDIAPVDNCKSISSNASEDNYENKNKKHFNRIVNRPKSKGKNPEVDRSIVWVLKREHCLNSFARNQFIYVRRYFFRFCNDFGKLNMSYSAGCLTSLFN